MNCRLYMERRVGGGGAYLSSKHKLYLCEWNKRVGAGDSV
jgi:hypothetical protein